MNSTTTLTTDTDTQWAGSAFRSEAELAGFTLTAAGMGIIAALGMIVFYAIAR
ncbi:hypothetical protein [Cellulomonas soli]|uniref:Uncharacterized protein n=1 Tax=Cellulomonas soli TaxID=931535 RepID=A0A512PHH8_9CELL|nr:hypothetical protein [Cellulomonas soli]NYI59153.1 hypothetical protein [Cellulomonas soli]GEP70656.1 hypothetical protein CSO01_33710 [Cellulomonas soli]